MQIKIQETVDYGVRIKCIDDIDLNDNWTLYSVELNPVAFEITTITYIADEKIKKHRSQSTKLQVSQVNQTHMNGHFDKEDEIVTTAPISPESDQYDVLSPAPKIVITNYLIQQLTKSLI